MNLKLDENLGSRGAATLATGFGKTSIEGKLWIVQRGHIREYQEEQESG